MIKTFSEKRISCSIIRKSLLLAVIAALLSCNGILSAIKGNSSEWSENEDEQGEPPGNEGEEGDPLEPPGNEGEEGDPPEPPGNEGEEGDPPEPPGNEGGKKLRVNGPLLEYGKDGGYTPVVLRGVNVGDLYHFKKFTIKPPDYAYIADAKTMNANCVRIAVHPNLWKAEKAKVFEYLKQNVQDALNAGLFVIIDYHTIGFPDGYKQELNDKVIAYDSTFTLAEDFWDTVSRDIKDGRVLLELWNEPVSERFTANPAAMWKALKPYWEKLIKIIRDNGNDCVVLAGGDYWTYELRGIRDNLLQDANTAYTWHIYGNHDRNISALWEMRLDRLNEVRPVVVTEWGFSTNPAEFEYASIQDFANKFVPGFLTAKNLHSLAWGYDPFYTPSMLSNGNYARLSEYGQYVVDYLRSCAQERP
ncbi:MAG: cellulase family glycosylhydrolase [Treponema sp.]|jgi:hypothetical protein|nr:cellulase family glycosylhydrolase [Treponema sp.]